MCACVMDRWVGSRQIRKRFRPFIRQWWHIILASLSNISAPMYGNWKSETYEEKTRVPTCVRSIPTPWKARQTNFIPLDLCIILQLYCCCLKLYLLLPSWYHWISNKGLIIHVLGKKVFVASQTSSTIWILYLGSFSSSFFEEVA